MKIDKKNDLSKIFLWFRITVHEKQAAANYYSIFIFILYYGVLVCISMTGMFWIFFVVILLLNLNNYQCDDRKQTRPFQINPPQPCPHCKDYGTIFGSGWTALLSEDGVTLLCFSSTSLLSLHQWQFQAVKKLNSPLFSLCCPLLCGNISTIACYTQSWYESLILCMFRKIDNKANWLIDW